MYADEVSAIFCPHYSSKTEKPFVSSELPLIKQALLLLLSQTHAIGGLDVSVSKGLFFNPTAANSRG
jgi:hypothetical protein